MPSERVKEITFAISGSQECTTIRTSEFVIKHKWMEPHTKGKPSSILTFTCGCYVDFSYPDKVKFVPHTPSKTPTALDIEHGHFSRSYCQSKCTLNINPKFKERPDNLAVLNHNMGGFFIPAKNVSLILPFAFKSAPDHVMAHTAATRRPLFAVAQEGKVFVQCFGPRIDKKAGGKNEIKSNIKGEMFQIELNMDIGGYTPEPFTMDGDFVLFIISGDAMFAMNQSGIMRIDNVKNISFIGAE